MWRQVFRRFLRSLLLREQQISAMLVCLSKRTPFHSALLGLSICECSNVEKLVMFIKGVNIYMASLPIGCKRVMKTRKAKTLKKHSSLVLKLLSTRLWTKLHLSSFHICWTAADNARVALSEPMRDDVIVQFTIDAIFWGSCWFWQHLIFCSRSRCPRNNSHVAFQLSFRIIAQILLTALLSWRTATSKAFRFLYAFLCTPQATPTFTSEILSSQDSCHVSILTSLVAFLP